MLEMLVDSAVVPAKFIYAMREVKRSEIRMLQLSNASWAESTS